jgi:pimeloyl-ACP methyl ester carboxylesterase
MSTDVPLYGLIEIFFTKVLVCVMAVLVLTATIIWLPFLLAKGQPRALNTTLTTAAKISKINPLPVLLIHGYLEDSSVWHKWEGFLSKDHIPYAEVDFGSLLGPFLRLYYGTYYDECGTAFDHGIDLTTVVRGLKESSGQTQINIVAHSKGGLDAREYLANSENEHDVANLIMIGTPNSGSPLAYSNDYCAPAVYDIRPGASDTTVRENNNTRYYTIAGDWNPSVVSNCPEVQNIFEFDWPQFEKEGFAKLQKPNDGLVPVSSVESLPYSNSLGHPSDCHTNLLSKAEYDFARTILLSGR